MSDEILLPGAEVPPGFRSGFAALVGRANVGKSTLLNHLVGAKVAIVSPVPQTTRHRILGVTNIPGRGQIAFLDSPGLHRPQHHLGERLNETARQVAGEADVLVLVFDASAGFGPGDEHVRAEVERDRGGRPVILVPNKIDQMNKGKLLPLIEQATREWGYTDVVPVSALSGDNVARLTEVVLSRLPEGPPLFPLDYVTDQGDRRMIAEIVREKLLARLRQEVPHSVAVVLDRLEPRPGGLLHVDASILVERPTQKAIVIGKGGAMLKEVGTEARRELETRLGTRVYLKLWVKVRENWRDRDPILHELGL
ncbi:MAG: GTPase Era [Acidobacteria bacterium]|nr:GTPase Era [Acidobacteriota bacterium]